MYPDPVSPRPTTVMSLVALLLVPGGAGLLAGLLLLARLAFIRRLGRAFVVVVFRGAQLAVVVAGLVSALAAPSSALALVTVGVAVLLVLQVLWHLEALLLGGGVW